MADTTNFIAVDIGASSGRVMLGRWDGARLALEELRRFWNGADEQGDGHLHWDAPRLLDEIRAGLAAYAARSSAPLAGIGIDTWAVDYGLLDGQGRLLGDPYAYRDWRTQGVPAQVDLIIPPERLYAITGIQRLPFNTIYQLFSARGDPQLAAAETLLLMPDLLGYWLTGRRVAEYTNATTTQLIDARTRTWSVELLDVLGLPARLLPPLVEPGTVLGNLLPEIRDAAGLTYDVPVIAVGTHDTASAVAAVPGLDQQSAYISSGTWSLVGVELPAPILSDEARALSVTNEGGVGGTIRLLKNVGGLWLLQECQRQWEREGQMCTWPQLVALAERAAPLRSIVDPDAPEFLAPADMPAAIRAACRSTNQAIPEDVGAMVRCCLESLALTYRRVIEALERVTGREITTIRVVGGGSQNALLCQLTADACGRPVVAGPAEATALGNILVQAVATGHLPDIAAGRRAVAESFPQDIYRPV
ncbi:rhamnulokinase [Oscillochloris sp. ZM17-4]|uniref:rhamnulokinase n=1 Tax=Oscillochloris sp. ZM17-4 TaxID=2866714 RepID=UPI001C73BD81|nr:rhamnulokinase family protein [Oscillochloris sp. ZM17-4]MBX0329269.1 rhamnulokinase [Oscillochloris sp. ZM17-4]